MEWKLVFDIPMHGLLCACSLHLFIFAGLLTVLGEKIQCH